MATRGSRRVLFLVFFFLWMDITTTELCVTFVLMVNCCEVLISLYKVILGGWVVGGGAWGLDGTGGGWGWQGGSGWDCIRGN